MAWLDDRLWCHPKTVVLSDKAFRVYINSLAYSSGFDLHGHLGDEQQAMVGSTRKIRDELLAASLWDMNGDGIVIHDWDEHNGRRDERRAKERDRKRAYRGRLSRGTGTGQDAGQTKGQGRDFPWDM